MIRAGCADLDGYLEGELSGGRRTSFEAHLAACQGCRKEVEAEAEVGRLLALARGRLEAPPRALLERLESRLPADRGAPRPVLTRRFAAAAAVLALCAGLWWTVGDRRQEVSAPTAPVVNRGAAARVRVSPGPGSSAIFLPVGSGNESASIFFVYNAVEVSRAEPAAPSPDPFRSEP